VEKSNYLNNCDSDNYNLIKEIEKFDDKKIISKKVLQKCI